MQVPVPIQLPLCTLYILEIFKHLFLVVELCLESIFSRILYKIGRRRKKMTQEIEYWRTKVCGVFFLFSYIFQGNGKSMNMLFLLRRYLSMERIGRRSMKSYYIYVILIMVQLPSRTLTQIRSHAQKYLSKHVIKDNGEQLIFTNHSEKVVTSGNRPITFESTATSQSNILPMKSLNNDNNIEENHEDGLLLQQRGTHPSTFDNTLQSSDRIAANACEFDSPLTRSGQSAFEMLLAFYSIIVYLQQTI